jgi:hypothetical protein
VAQAARALGLEQKSLYRRREEILKRLRSDLEAEGIGAQDARELLSTLDWGAALDAQGAASGSFSEDGGSRPSHEEGRSRRLEG